LLGASQNPALPENIRDQANFFKAKMRVQNRIPNLNDVE
jgi:hypothetical protein